MIAEKNEKLISRLIGFGAAFITIFILSGSITDPVNVTKFLALGILGCAVSAILITQPLRSMIRKDWIVWLTIALFLLASASSLIFSHSPLVQGIYGSYGRNNGFLTYLFLGLLFLGALLFRLHDSFQRVVNGLLIAGLINAFYCLWVIAFGDFIGWSNPYGHILGTLGNPNFIGAFLGIFIAAYLATGLGALAPTWFRYSLIIVLPITAFEIYKSNAIQGRVVGAAGIAIVGFYYIRSRFGRIWTWLYAVSALASGTFALLGALQTGPLTPYIYKTSVSLRGQYWLAGWNTGSAHPLTGVGMDAFGDWYRRARDAHALVLPGVNTVVNAAHNVFMDMFAFGGWPLLISYILVMFLGGWALFRLTKRTHQFDPILVVLASAWFGYQLQSIISINQIGLAVWGWVLNGAAIAYEHATRVVNDSSSRQGRSPSRKRTKNELDAKILLTACTGAFVGLILALPPIASDSKWRAAQVSRSVQQLETTMQPSYFNPQNSTKYLTNIQNLESSQLFDLSHKYALEAVKWNPESFELWKVLYLVKNSTQDEKATALKNMKRLDPLNPDVTSTQ